MSDAIELNREEITRLSRMEDPEGHAWVLYLLLKNHMDHYTGIVHVDTKILAQVLQEKLLIERGHINSDINYYLRDLLYQLLKVDIISDQLLKNSILSIKLPIAYSETWYKMITMLQSGLDMKPIITDHFHVDDFQKAFDKMLTGNTGKVILEWN